MGDEAGYRTCCTSPKYQGPGRCGGLGRWGLRMENKAEAVTTLTNLLVRLACGPTSVMTPRVIDSKGVWARHGRPQAVRAAPAPAVRCVAARRLESGAKSSQEIRGRGREVSLCRHRGVWSGQLASNDATALLQRAAAAGALPAGDWRTLRRPPLRPIIQIVAVFGKFRARFQVRV